MSCKTHPKYKGLNRPRSKCLNCWMKYAEIMERYANILTQHCKANQVWLKELWTENEKLKVKQKG